MASLKESKLQEKPSALKKEQPALKKQTIFFSILKARGKKEHDPDPDPDPLVQSHKYLGTVRFLPLYVTYLCARLGVYEYGPCFMFGRPRIERPAGMRH